MKLQKSDAELDVYSEGKRKKIYVGRLKRNTENIFEFEYSRKYLKCKGAIAIGPELPLSRLKHTSKENELFPSFEDRIPSPLNPAYREYCENCGIDAEEKNAIVLLTSIGKRGPSTFVFESVCRSPDENIRKILIDFRKNTGFSLRTVSDIFNFNYVTLQRVEKGVSTDRNTIRLLYIYLSFPDVGRWVTRLNSSGLLQFQKERLTAFFRQVELTLSDKDMPSADG